MEKLTIPVSEFEDRIARAREKMTERGLDALLVYGYKSNGIRYFCNYSPRYSDLNCALFILPLEAEPTLLVRWQFHEAEARRQSHLKDVREATDLMTTSWSFGMTSLQRMAEETRSILQKHRVAERRIGLAGLEPEMAIEAPLRRAMPSAAIEDANGLVGSLRMIKSENEIKMLRRSGQIVDEAMEACMAKMTERVRDYDIFATAEHVMRTRGCGLSVVYFARMVGGGWHLQPDGRQLQDGDLYEFGPFADYEGYWIEGATVVSFGEPTAGGKRAMKDSAEVYASYRPMLRPGVPVSEIYDVASNTAKKLGYDGIGPAFGHSIGLDLLEYPYFIPGVHTLLQPGMVVNVHAQLYSPGDSAALIGGNFLITERGADPVSKVFEEAPVV